MNKWLTISIVSGAATAGFLAGKFSDQIVKGSKAAAGFCADKTMAGVKATASAVKSCIPSKGPANNKQAVEDALNTLNSLKTEVEG